MAFKKGKMKILVTGAAGFIGFHVVKKLLLLENTEIVGIDNINDYYDVNLKYSRLEICGINRDIISETVTVESKCYPTYHFQKLDVSDKIALCKLFDEHSFDYVIHLAAQAGVRYSIENPDAYVQSNLVGFANILECSRHSNIKHLIYASSSSVYGMNNAIPYSEDDNVDYPVSFYAATKKSNELMAHSYSHLYKLPTTGLRFFTVYGPWGRPDMAPMIFAKAISEGKPIKIFNNGNMMRDFTYIDDIVKGVVKVMITIPDEKDKHPFYRIFNIGNSCAVNLMDFVRTIEKNIGKKAILEMLPMQPGDVKETFADTSLLQEYTNYKPSTALEEGIAHFIEWYIGYYGCLK